jgi:hypothetical protein
LENNSVLTVSAVHADGKTMTGAGSTTISKLGGDTSADLENIAVTGGVTITTNNSDNISFVGKLANTNMTLSVVGGSSTSTIDFSGGGLAAGYNKSTSTMTLNTGVTAVMKSSDADDLTVSGAGTTKINVGNNTNTLTATADGTDADGNETITVTYSLDGAANATVNYTNDGTVDITSTAAIATKVAALLNGVTGITASAAGAVATAAATNKAQTLTMSAAITGSDVNGLAVAVVATGSLANDLNLTNVGTNTTLALATDTTFSGTFKAEAVTVTGAKELDF